MSDSEQITIYQLKIFILGISPMIWRRFKVHSNSTITDLHYIVQIVMGWTDSQATFSGEASPEKLAHPTPLCHPRERLRDRSNWWHLVC